MAQFRGNYNSYHYGTPKAKVNVRFEITNDYVYKKILDDMGRVPKVALSKGTKMGAKLLLQATKRNAPKKTGLLRKAMKLVREKAKRYSTFYQVTYGKAYNDQLQKKSKLQAAGGKSPKVNKLSKRQGNKEWGYYPASLEYGYEHFYYGHHLGYKHGQYFMRDTAEQYSKTVKNEVAAVVWTEYKKRWEGRT